MGGVNTPPSGARVKTYLDRSGRTCKRFKNNCPGEEWAKLFMRRNSARLSLRMCENIKKNRASVSRDTVNDYFDNLEESLDGVPAKTLSTTTRRTLATTPDESWVLYDGV